MPGIAIYARKSTESEDRQILSIDSQVRELRELASRERLQVNRVFTESMSAKAPGRPIFNELYRLVQKGDLDGIICWKLDRLARNPVDGGALIWAMEENKLKHLITPQRSFGNTGNDKFWMQLEFGMAKKYVDDLSDNVRRGIRAKIEAGWLPGLAPIGYINDRNTHTIQKDPERFPLIRRIWDAVLTGESSVAKVLDKANNEWGLRTRPLRRRGGRPLSQSGIFCLLRDHFYYGVLPHKGELFKGSHEPMITKAEYDRVQAILRSRSRPRPKKYEFQYGGLMRCGECGSAVTAEHKRIEQKYYYTYYHCTRQKQGVRCAQPSIEEKELTGQIEEFLRSITIPRRIAEWALQAVATLESDEEEKRSATKTSLVSRASACDRELRELLNMKLRGLLSDEEFVRKKNELETEKAQLHTALGNLEGRQGVVTEQFKSFFEFSVTVLKRFQNGTFADRRTIMTATASKLVLRDRKLSVSAHKPFDVISGALSPPVDCGGSFETRSLGLTEPRIERLETHSPDWRSLAKDVRRFFKAHQSEYFPFLRVSKSVISERARATGRR